MLACLDERTTFATMELTSLNVCSFVVFLGYDAIMRDSLAPTPAMMRIRDNGAKGELFHFCRKARPDA